MEQRKYFKGTFEIYESTTVQVMVIMVVVAEKRAVFSALISEASDRKLTFELQRLLVVVIKLGQNKGLLEHDHE